MTLDLAVDLSNFTSWPLREADVHCWIANGVSRGIVQAIQGGGRYPVGHTADQMQLLVTAGMARTDCYVLPFEGDTIENLRAKRSLTRGFRIGQWWFDLEEPMSLDYVRFVLREMDTWNADEGPTGIYTADWFWDRQGWQAVTEFSDRKLWAMQQNLNASFRPFGGWTNYALRQYWLDAILCGVSGIDVSIINPNQEVVTVIRPGEGIANKLSENGDQPLFGHVFRDETDDDGQTYTVEEVYGTKGRYVASNVSGEWVTGGPF